MLIQQVGALVRQQRYLLQLTQDELARRAGVSRTAVARLERVGKRSMQTGVIERILHALDLQVDVGLRPAEPRRFPWQR